MTERLPRFYHVGPNTIGGYHSMGHSGELAVPDYAYPELGPDRCPMGSPARLVLWFESWEDATEALRFLESRKDRG